MLFIFSFFYELLQNLGYKSYDKKMQIKNVKYRRLFTIYLIIFDLVSLLLRL